MSDQQIDAAVKTAIRQLRAGDSALFVAAVLRVKLEDADVR